MQYILYFIFPGDVHYDAAAVPPGQNFAEMDIEKWLSSSPLVLHMMDYVFHKCFNVSFVSVVFKMNSIML